MKTMRHERHPHHQFLAFSGSSSGRPKYTTRHLAALDFLLHVPMSREAEIRQAGLLSASHAQQLEENEAGGDSESDRLFRSLNNNDDNDNNNNDSTEREGEEGESGSAALRALSSSSAANNNNNPLNANNNSNNANNELLDAFPEFAGKKLKGPVPAVGRYPGSIRHVLSRITDESALCRQWEHSLLLKKQAKAESLLSSHAHAHTHTHASTSENSTSGINEPHFPLLESRLFFSRSRSYPLAVCSVIQYDAKEEKARIEKLKAEDAKGLEVYELPHRDWRGFSYKPLFKPLGEEEREGFLYDPDSLDDPHMLYGAHRYVSQRSAKTGPVLSSIILYVNKDKLRESLNEQFHERHPSLPPSLTLSKIRAIKKKALFSCLKIGFELSTIALAMLNFERLCLKGFVSKINRKLSMAVSLLLAFKFCENDSMKHHKAFEQLLDMFDRDWSLPRKQVFEAEFGAYVHLGLSLHAPYPHIHLMYTRLLKMINRSSRQYLGDEMHDLLVQDILTIEREKENSRALREMKQLEEERRLQEEQETQQQQQEREQEDKETGAALQSPEERQRESSRRMASFWSIAKRRQSNTTS